MVCALPLCQNGIHLGGIDGTECRRWLDDDRPNDACSASNHATPRRCAYGRSVAPTERVNLGFALRLGLRLKLVRCPRAFQLDFTLLAQRVLRLRS